MLIFSGLAPESRACRARRPAHCGAASPVGVAAGVVQFGHYISDRLTDPGKLTKPVLGDNAVERFDKRRKRVCGALVGFGAEIIVAGERCAPTELDEQRRDSRSLQRRHLSGAAAARPAGSSTPPSGR